MGHILVNKKGGLQHPPLVNLTNYESDLPSPTVFSKTRA